MIYTVTLNPALDYVMHPDTLQSGTINRSRFETLHIGGKGINVSMVLAELGVSSCALGFTAGFTGDAIAQEVAAHGITTCFVRLDQGYSRINVKIQGTIETELNGQGPDISPEQFETFLRTLARLQEGDTLVLAGSIPASLPENTYERILAAVQQRKVCAVVDATGKLLRGTLPYQPFLVKPNHHELAEFFDTSLHSLDEIIHCAARLQEMGARNVLVSMAEDGAVLLEENGQIHHSGVCKGIVKNSVGAGDSMVAGFLAGCQHHDLDYALRLGTAAGGATAFSEGLAKRDDILRLLAELP